MSNSLAENISDIEEGEIHTDEDPSIPVVAKKSNLNLEDLSSCDEVFSSDSIASRSRKRKRYSKERGRESNAPSHLEKKDTPKEKPSAPKRKVGRRRAQVPLREACDKAVAEETNRNVRPRRRQPRRRCSITLSSESESGICKVSAKSTRRRPKKFHSDNGVPNVAHKPKISKISAKKIVQTRNGEPPEGVLVSCPEKALPKTSLKRRLMNMITFSSASSEADNQGTVPSGVAEESEVDPKSATKESVQSEPVKKVFLKMKSRKRLISNHDKEICQGKVAVMADFNVKPVIKLEKDIEVVSSSKAPEMLATVKEEAKSADDPNNTTVTGDDDLAELRKLALESSTTMAGKKKVPIQAAVGAREEADDLTELRLQALHSAVLKKHIARKAKAAAAAAASSVSTSSTQSAPPAPIIAPAALAPAVPAPAPALPVLAPAQSAQTPVSMGSSPEQRQAHAAAWNSEGYQCAENCDKTTLLVDMDLGNTSDEDSLPAANGDSCIAISPYYVPELWTPIKDDQEPRSADGNFHGSCYQSNSDYGDLSVPLNQSTHIPFAPSAYDTQQAPNLLPIVVPPLVYPPQTIPSLEPGCTPHRNKYSERPNLIKLPVAPMRKERQLISLTNLNGVESYPSSETSLSSYTNSKSIPRVSSLINIDLLSDSPRNVVNQIDKNEFSKNCFKWKETPTRDNMRQCPTDGADTSDTENMDITSMIVVDEIVCTSPEPDSTKNLDYASPVSQGASNVLADVPVPSSQYANRSMLPSNAPSTMRVVQATKSPIIMFKPKVPPNNPFMLNNLRKDPLKHKPVNSNVLTKRGVALNPGNNIDVVVTNRPNLEVPTLNQMSFISNRGPVNNSPTTNKGGPGRFVIHLGDDSDSDDDGETVDQELFPLPERTIINERALQKDANLNQPSQVSPLNNPAFSAQLDAFLKDTRAKYDRKAALLKQRNGEEAVCATSSTSKMLACSPKRPVPPNRTIKMPGKEIGAGNTSPNNSDFFKNRTVVKKVKPPEQMQGILTITASATSRTVKNNMPLLKERKIEVVLCNNVHSESTNQSNIEAALCTANSKPMVAACPPKRPVSMSNHTVKMSAKKIRAGDALPDNSDFFENRTVVQCMSRNISAAGSETGRIAKSPLFTGRKREFVPQANTDMSTRRPAQATSGEGICRELNTLVNSCTPSSDDAKMASKKLKLMSGVSSIAGEMPKKSLKAETLVGTFPSTNVGSISSTNNLVKLSVRAVQKPNAEISKGNASQAECGTISKASVVEISGSASDIDDVPKKCMSQKVSGTGSVISKPQALNSINTKLLKQGSPIQKMAIGDDKPVLIGSTPAPTDILSSKQPNAASTVNLKKPASGNNVQALKTGQCTKIVVAPLCASPGSKALPLPRVAIKSPVVSIAFPENQVTTRKNAMDTGPAPQEAVKLKTQSIQNATLEMNEVTLESMESKLLKKRKELFVDLTVILHHLNNSSKLEHAINEMQETISQQEKIIELARRSIKLTHERIACETKKRAQTFNLIHDKRKTVASKRDLCNKLRDECINLGSKMKGLSYMAPEPFESELRMRLEEVAVGITNTMKGVSPQKKVTLPPDKSPNGAECPAISPTASSSSVPTATGSIQSELLINHEANGKTRSKVLWLVDCPYEINGICGDVAACPFVHKKHR